MAESDWDTPCIARGDRPFEPQQATTQDTRGNPSDALDTLGSRFEKYRYVDGYYWAADTVLERAVLAERLRVVELEALVFPALHLCRHYIELSLKCFVRRACELPVPIERELILKRIYDSDHNLHKLWNVTKIVMASAYHDEGKSWEARAHTELDGAEKVILAFHDIDQQGQRFRYDAGRDGRVWPTGLPFADPAQVRDAIEKLHEYLNGCIVGLDSWEDVPFPNEGSV